MTLSTRLQMAQRLLNGLKKRARRGFTLIELLVVVVIIGILASVALPSFIGAQDKARNASVAANINTIRMALEQYGTDNNGSYPLQANWLNAAADGIRSNNYLPGNRMPKAPWSTGPQTVAATPNTTLNNVSSLAGGTATLSSVGSLIGTADAGKVATTPTQTLDYGFVAYDYAPDNQIYVIYGTGKKNKTAVVAGGSSNGSN